MVIDLHDRIQALRDEVLSFVEELIIPQEPILLAHTSASKALQSDLVKMAKARGLWAMGHPESMGGKGLSWRDYAFVNEAIGRSDAAMEIFGSYSVQTCLMLDVAATEWQRDKILLPLVNGDIHVAFSVTEPGAASSDPTNISTTAELVDGQWIVNGKKWYTSGALDAQWFCVMCRTEPLGSPLHEAFSMILVPASSEGFAISRDVFVMGLDSNHPECTYSGVRVPEDHILGQRGQGFQLFQTRLGPARLTNCMRWIGQAQRAFDLMCERMNSRHIRDGALLADKQLMQSYVYQSYVEIQSARLLVLHAADKMDQGQQARVEISAAKTQAANMLQSVLDRAIQVHGALGVCDDAPLERMFRMSRIYRIVDGPDEVHIERVGKLILKEYREGRGWDFSAR